jgi:hypothetical protein
MARQLLPQHHTAKLSPHGSRRIPITAQWCCAVQRTKQPLLPAAAAESCCLDGVLVLALAAGQLLTLQGAAAAAQPGHGQHMDLTLFGMYETECQINSAQLTRLSNK